MPTLKKLHPKIKFIDLSIKANDFRIFDKAFKKVLLKGNFILGDEVSRFEKEFTNFLKVKYCIGVGNGLEALQIALMALSIKKGDEVITTPISAAATTLAILSVGATPVFVDTNKDGLMDINLIPKFITKKTKVILPVHLFGNSVDMNKLKAICKKNNIYLIEDAAQAHGSQFMGKSLGSFGDLGCFSFYPTKNLGAFGDGGAIVTQNKKLASICYQIRDYGQQSKYIHSRYGLNSRLDELQASFLSVKLKYLEKENKKRRYLADIYSKNLRDIKGIEIITYDKKVLGNYHLLVIRTPKRNALKKYLSSNNIPTSIHYPKILPQQPFLKKEYGKLTLPVSQNLVDTCLSLPCHPKMSTSQVKFISEKIKSFFSSK